jgi:flagellar secretion chaperone FliS
MAANPYHAYKTNSITTQTPGQIVVLLYEGAIKFLKQGAQAMENKQYAEKGSLLGRATDIIGELNASLDLEVGGEIARNLRNLYIFMIQEITRASFQNDPEKVRGVVGCLEELLDGWKQVAA